MLKKFALLLLLSLSAQSLWAAEKPAVQIVQLMDLPGISADEVDEFLQKQILSLGYRVVALTEKPKDFYILSILNSNVAAGGAVATGLSSVIEHYDGKTDKEYLVDHSTTVMLVAGPDMEKSARLQGLKALQGIVENLDRVLKSQKLSGMSASGKEYLQ